MSKSTKLHLGARFGDQLITAKRHCYTERALRHSRWVDVILGTFTCSFHSDSTSSRRSSSAHIYGRHDRQRPLWFVHLLRASATERFQINIIIIIIIKSKQIKSTQIYFPNATQRHTE